MRRLILLGGKLAETWRFHANRVTHGLWPALLGEGARIVPVGEDGLLHRIETSDAALTFYGAVGRHGLRHGGGLPWQDLRGVVTRPGLSDRGTVRAVRRLLARLPADVSLHFTAGAGTERADLLVRAFTRAGFAHAPNPTYTRPASPAGDVAEEAGKNVRRQIAVARRDCEVVEIGAAAFIRFYLGNLAEAGRRPAFDMRALGRILAAGEARSPAGVRIIAARRRAGAGCPHPPLDAAFALGLDEGGILRLACMTHRGKGGEGEDAPHAHAGKLLIAHAMEIAAAGGYGFDTDGTTPGTELLYRRFGNMQAGTRHCFGRTTMRFRFSRLVRARPAVPGPVPGAPVSAAGPLGVHAPLPVVRRTV